MPLSVTSLVKAATGTGTLAHTERCRTSQVRCWEVAWAPVKILYRRRDPLPWRSSYCSQKALDPSDEAALISSRPLEVLIEGRTPPKKASVGPLRVAGAQSPPTIDAESITIPVHMWHPATAGVDRSRRIGRAEKRPAKKRPATDLRSAAPQANIVSQALSSSLMPLLRRPRAALLPGATRHLPCPILQAGSDFQASLDGKPRIGSTAWERMDGTSVRLTETSTIREYSTNGPTPQAGAGRGRRRVTKVWQNMVK